MRVNKQNNKLFVYISSDVINSLNLKENDEIEFLPFNNKSFLIAKKNDLTALLTGSIQNKPEIIESQKTSQNITQQNQNTLSKISNEEIIVLKKLDELRYTNRTVENVNKILDVKFRSVLQQLLKKKAVFLLKDKDGKEHYSISKYVYDTFLMRKKTNSNLEQSKQIYNNPQTKSFNNANSRFFYLKKIPEEQENAEVEYLDKNGYIVLQTEAEAASISSHLEESIRQGMILGTRAFNKKFYIVTRSFFEKYSANIIKSLRQNPMKVSEISEKEGLNEDAVRGILYLLSEAGDIREQRRDVFSIA
ncbi:MAG: hypothetical protein ACP5M9_02095 [Candidatus Micrarchaeia archaeon]